MENTSISELQKKLAISFFSDNINLFKDSDIIFRKDKEIVLHILSMDSSQYEFIDECLKKDNDIIICLLKQNCFCLYYFSDELKSNKTILEHAYKLNHMSIMFAHESIKKDKNFMASLINNNTYALEHCHDELKYDQKYILQLMQLTKDLFLCRFIKKMFTGKEIKDLENKLKIKFVFQKSKLLEKTMFEFDVTLEIHSKCYFTNIYNVMIKHAISNIITNSIFTIIYNFMI